MATDNRKYTKLDFSQIVSDNLAILRAKQGPLADTAESSYGRTIIELTAANADLTAAWTEEVFKEGFLHTAKTPEAIFEHARTLGYSIRRPVPSKAGFGISLKRTGIYPNVKIFIPKGTEFNVSGATLTTVDDTEYYFDRTSPDYTTGLMLNTSGRPVLAEGSFVTQSFFSDGTQNQEFVIGNANASDWFGDGDPNWIEADTMLSRKSRFFVVSSDASLTDNYDPDNGFDDIIYWKVNRIGFEDPTLTTSVNDLTVYSTDDSNKTINYTVWAETANDGKLRIKFSDDIISAIPYGKITVKYFVTKGEIGNQLNVSGSVISTTSDKILISQADGQESDLTINDFNIALITDIRGGLNIESIVSVQQNGSKIYSSLNSLGDRSSYNTFLSRYSQIKYAHAYGEDVLSKFGKFTNNGDIKQSLKYSNLVRFTALKDLYREKNNVYYPTGPDEYYVDGYKVNGLMYLWQYDYTELPSKKDLDIFRYNTLSSIQATMLSDSTNPLFTSTDTESTKQTKVNDFLAKYIVPYDNVPVAPTNIFNANLTPLDFAEVGTELEDMLLSLNRRGYLTLGGGQHMYVQPTVHDFTIKADIILMAGNNFSDITGNIKTAIYKYLKQYTQFSSVIFRSKIESLIQQFPEVVGVNLTFKEITSDYSKLQLNNLTWLGTDTSQIINQVGLSIDGFDAGISYIYSYVDLSGTENSNPLNTVDFKIGDQHAISDAIKAYYLEKFTYTDSSNVITLKNNITQSQINEFCTFVWDRMLQELYNPVYDQFKISRATGNVNESDSVYAMLENIKTWEFNSGALAFKTTDSIQNMTEADAGKILYNYFVYAIEYIKLIRRILGPIAAKNLIDSDGNISRYTNPNEIVQFNISTSDLKVRVEQEPKNG